MQALLDLATCLYEFRNTAIGDLSPSALADGHVGVKARQTRGRTECVVLRANRRRRRATEGIDVNCFPWRLDDYSTSLPECPIVVDSLLILVMTKCIVVTFLRNNSHNCCPCFHRSSPLLDYHSISRTILLS